MEEYFLQYGPIIVYGAVFLWSIIEGETLILLGGALSYKYDEISLAILMLLAFLGSCTADQTLFFIGRRYGPSLIERKPMLKSASKRVFYHLHRHSTFFIISFRFIYGIRTASPIIIGAAGVPIKRFAILNFIAAIFWSVLSCSAGYLIGYFFADIVEDFIRNIGRYSQYFAYFLIGGIAILSLSIYLWRRQRP